MLEGLVGVDVRRVTVRQFPKRVVLLVDDLLVLLGGDSFVQLPLAESESLSLRASDVRAHLHDLDLTLDLFLMLTLEQIGLYILLELTETVCSSDTLRNLIPILRATHTSLLTYVLRLEHIINFSLYALQTISLFAKAIVQVP